MKKITIFLTFILLCTKIFSQSIDVKWSDQFEFDNKKDGFFDGFVGSNNKYIYGKFSNLALNPKKSNHKVKLIVFDKTTMKKAGEAELAGYDKNSDNKKYDYYKTITLNNLVYVFWTLEEKKIVSLYVQSFDVNLKKVNGKKKIYELNESTKESDADKLIVIYNKDLNDKILIAKEFGAKVDGENLKLEYKILNPDFSFVTSKQVTLPIIVNKQRRGLFSGRSANFNSLLCDYEFGNDGNLYVQDVIKMSKEEKALLKKGESSTYPLIVQVQATTGKVTDYKVKFPKKNTFKFSSLITDNGIKLYGFYSDLDKDVKGNDTHGTFYILLDKNNFTVITSKFSYFDKNFLDVLYAADKENQKKGNGLFKSKKAKESDKESIDDNYVIESVIQDGKDILLFCSIMNNWSRTVCTSNGKGGGQTCNTYYYCTKSNVTTFKLNNDGDIVWAKNLDRSITYSRWNVYDLNVMKSNDSYYVTYGSAFQANAKKKNLGSAKSRRQLTDRIEYAIFDGKSGDYKKNEYAVNKVNTKSSEKKFISADNISVYDNKMYTSCIKTKIKPLTWLSCLCPPVFYVLYFNGNSRVGKGSFGTITPLK